MDQIKADILKALEQISPTLQKDGGDVEFVKLTDDNIVQVRLTGACKECPMSEVTLKEGIEKFIKSEIPAIKAVEAISW